MPKEPNVDNYVGGGGCGGGGGSNGGGGISFDVGDSVGGGAGFGGGCEGDITQLLIEAHSQANAKSCSNQGNLNCSTILADLHD